LPESALEDKPASKVAHKGLVSSFGFIKVNNLPGQSPLLRQAPDIDLPVGGEAIT